MILIGTRTFMKSLGMVAGFAACERCGAEVRCEILRERLWFTLFFIPILPLWSHFSLACPSCGYRRDLGRREAMALLDAGERF